MKNRNLVLYIIALILIFTISTITIIMARANIENDGTNISTKIENEIKYLNDTTLKMINEINNLHTKDEIQIERTSAEDSNYNVVNDSVVLRDNSEIDWNQLQSQAENLYESWTTITLDLNTMNVTNEDILAYNTNLDNLIKSIQEENKVNSTICLANLYGLLPKYMSETSSDDAKIKIANVKSNVIYAYSLAGTDRWEEVLNYLGQAEDNLTSFINLDNNTSSTQQARINKAYVLLKELIKSSNEQNLDIFYLKYISLIQELEKI